MRRLLGAVLLAACGETPSAPPAFDKQILDTEFRAEGVAILDVDRDGVLDLATDQFWYRGPDFTPNEIRTPETWDPADYSDDVGCWPRDLDGDGWTDLIVAPYAADAMYWYRNPQGASGHWERYLIAPELHAGMEVPVYRDLFGDGRPVMLMGIEDPGILAFFEPAADPYAPWIANAISEPGFGGAYRYFHGLGTGDVDGDGVTDVLTTAGWFEQTIVRTRWVFHPLALGSDPCSTMFAHDLDGDGRADLLCAHPHSYGFDAWMQEADHSFARQPIDTSISQMHSVGMGDLDGDGVPEVVTGKNWRAHPLGYGDPGDDDPAYLAYWTIGAGGELERHDIDDDSGVGRTITIGDVDLDGDPDIVISNKKGLFVFRQR